MMQHQTGYSMAQFSNGVYNLGTSLTYTEVTDPNTGVTNRLTSQQSIAIPLGTGKQLCSASAMQ